MTDQIPLHEFLELEYLGGNDGSGVGEVRMPVKQNAFGFTRNLHGGAIATLVDLACALAAVR
ncbi:MAG: PaaI family thioesterase, partial [Actinomycetes bacterium]